VRRSFLFLAQLVAVVGHAHARFHAVLAGLHVELALRVEGTARALEEQVRAFAARQLAFRSEVSSHGDPVKRKRIAVRAGCAGSLSIRSYVAWAAAAVVRNRGHVGDARDLHAQRVQRAHRGFAAGAGALDPHLEILHAVFRGGAAGALRGDLRSERRRLARALEARTAGRRPRQGVALPVGDRDDRVVEGRGMCAMPSATLFLTFLRTRAPAFGCCVAICGFLDRYLPAGLAPVLARDFFGPLRVRALVRVRCPRTGRPRRCRTPR